MLSVVGLAWVSNWSFAGHRLVGIMIAVYPCFFLGGLTVQHEVFLRQQMRFGDLEWIQVLRIALLLH
jgi:hypothetical protein